MLSLSCCPCIAQTTAEGHADNTGEDLTAPTNRFDLRMQFETLPDQKRKGEIFDDLTTETITLRTDLLLFAKPDQLALRFDLPLKWTDKPNESKIQQLHPVWNGDPRAGDLRAELDHRWAVGGGLRAILPTATGEAFGDGKWQLVPTVGVRRVCRKSATEATRV